jgi:archaellum biogenesis ATPase FlaH
VSSAEREKGDFIGHYQCVANDFDYKEGCSSSDGLAIYMKTNDDGNNSFDGYCWVCHQAFSKDEIQTSALAKDLGLDPNGVSEKTFVIKPKPEPITIDQIKELKQTIGFTETPYRSIKPDWLKYFGFMVKRDSHGNPTQVYYPETEHDKVTGFKIRVLPKRFNKVGRTGLSSQLGGQFRYKSPTKRVLICSGENDGAASWGMLKEYYDSKGYGALENVHVVWGTCGEGSLSKQVAAQYEFLDGYSEIIIGLDNDTCGIKSAIDCAKILPANKVKIATWTLKDPHELLEKHKSGQFIRDFFNAKEYIDSGIKSAADAQSEVEEFLMATKVTLPSYLHRVQEKMRGGIRSTGAIVNICADTSVGKSFFTDNLEYHWFFNSPLIPTIVSLERTAGEFLSDMYSLHLKKNLTWFEDGQDAIDYLHREDVKKLCEELVYDSDGKSRFHIIDERSGDIEALKRQVDRSIKQFGSKLIVFDPLTDFLRALPMDQQENFMMWEKMMKKEGVVFINVLHTRKPSSSKDGEIRKVTEYDVLGSGTFVQSADINIVLNRNKMAECLIEKNTTIVDMPKCRGGSTGEICSLYYDPETRQQYDFDDYFAKSRHVSNSTTVESVKPNVLDDKHPINSNKVDIVVAVEETQDGVFEATF